MIETPFVWSKLSTMKTAQMLCLSFNLSPNLRKFFISKKTFPCPSLHVIFVHLWFENYIWSRIVFVETCKCGGWWVWDNIDKRHLPSSPVESFTGVTKSILIIMIILEKITIDTLAINIINITNNGTRCKQRAVVRPSTKASLMLFSASTGSPPSPSSPPVVAPYRMQRPQDILHIISRTRENLWPSALILQTMASLTTSRYHKS